MNKSPLNLGEELHKPIIRKVEKIKYTYVL